LLAFGLSAAQTRSSKRSKKIVKVEKEKIKEKKKKKMIRARISINFSSALITNSHFDDKTHTLNKFAVPLKYFYCLDSISALDLSSRGSKTVGSVIEGLGQRLLLQAFCFARNILEHGVSNCGVRVEANVVLVSVCFSSVDCMKKLTVSFSKRRNNDDARLAFHFISAHNSNSSVDDRPSRSSHRETFFQPKLDSSVHRGIGVHRN
jgi:hypothetical protein